MLIGQPLFRGEANVEYSWQNGVLVKLHFDSGGKLGSKCLMEFCCIISTSAGNAGGNIFKIY